MDLIRTVCVSAFGRLCAKNMVIYGTVSYKKRAIYKFGYLVDHGNTKGKKGRCVI